MMANSRRFFKEYDPVTSEKLSVFSDYLRSWLPTMLHGPSRAPIVAIYDLCCGPGSTSKGEPGSPLLAVEAIKAFGPAIRTSGKSVCLVLNDRTRRHVDQLESQLGEGIVDNDGNQLASVEYHRKDVQDLMPKLLPRLRGSEASFVFVDQFGVKQVSENLFVQLHSCDYTDVLFFVASSWFERFADRPEAADWGLSGADFATAPSYMVHRLVTAHFRNLVGGSYYVAPYTLKRKRNVYGLVFASQHPRGLEKFVEVAWKHDPVSGEANFDLFGDGRSPQIQPSLLESQKLLDFRKALGEKLQEQVFKSDRDIWLFALESGITPGLAKPMVMDLVKDGDVSFREGSKTVNPRLSKAAFKQPRTLVYR